MLKITVEVIPFGEDDQTETIQKFYIVNEGRVLSRENDDSTLRIYGIFKDDPRTLGKRVGQVLHFRDRGALELVRAAIEKIR